ncbi:acyl-CoA N-acyltransferase [Limtongia smithiae]|uniref:acyl-CoA N-acyltransferase n=1 Tax=Limtongia smithiae TaxID=1125753 RepID=UPI0034CF72FF
MALPQTGDATLTPDGTDAKDYDAMLAAMREQSSEALNIAYADLLQSVLECATLVDAQLTGTFRRANDLSTTEAAQCLDLVRANLEDMYRATIGWSPRKKMREMREDGLVYLLVAAPERDDDDLVAFASFMPTYEDDAPVLYIYEVQVSERFRGNGLGSSMLAALETIATRVGLPHCMLTVFSMNTRACEFYARRNYIAAAHSPQRITLRRGVVKDPPYWILEKTMPLL